MLGAKDAIRIVPYFVLPQFYPIFAYREADAPLLCSYRGGSLSHKTTPVQAHRGFRLLTLASSDIFYHKKESSPILRELLLITLTFRQAFIFPFFSLSAAPDSKILQLRLQ